MKEESKRELLQLEQLNAHMFQVLGALKGLNFKVKSFVLKLQRVDEADEVQLHSLNQGFQAFSRDIDFFKQEYQLIADADLPMPMLNHFVQNVDRLFFKGSDPYTLVEMRRISVYMYRMADLMLGELLAQKTANETKIHALHAQNGKYYFNRK